MLTKQMLNTIRQWQIANIWDGDSDALDEDKAKNYQVWWKADNLNEMLEDFAEHLIQDLAGHDNTRQQYHVADAAVLNGIKMAHQLDKRFVDQMQHIEDEVDRLYLTHCNDLIKERLK